MKSDFNKNNDPFVVKEKKYSFGNLKDSSYHLGWMEDSFLMGENDNETLRRTFDLKKVMHSLSFHPHLVKLVEGLTNIVWIIILLFLLRI